MPTIKCEAEEKCQKGKNVVMPAIRQKEHMCHIKKYTGMIGQRAIGLLV